MSQQDKSFFTTFVAVMGFLVVFAFVIYFIAQNVVNGGSASDDNAQLTQIIEENIKPVGSVKVGDAAGAGAASSAGPRAGADIYNSFCMACHATGAAGAPKTGDRTAWQPRFAQGMDTLLNHAVNGLNAMPPKGTCGDCSDDELKGAIAYMLNETGFKVEVAAAAPAAATAPAASAADGKKIYDSACMACHATGAAGAPVKGDKAAWAPRIAQGMDTLVSHAVNGLNAMPPRGACGSCSDADLKAAVEYMVGESK